MKAVITGDIINSRDKSPEEALNSLKSVLQEYGGSPRQWEIYRGDSFQLMTAQPQESFCIAIRIKAALKTVKKRDVRMAIGIGDVDYEAETVTESNGEAFVRSGARFEQLEKEKVNLAVQTPWRSFDDEMNLYIRLALIAMDHWSEASAEFMDTQLTYRNLTQKELAKKLGIGQSSVSERKKRANCDEILELEQRYKRRLKEYL
ncbi:SatD family protein [Fodinibius halophilus]|uniref:Transcriptional regulator n=1 Tax=Fodinibius halophilus TaxID=1736908 RepID=A0A6M1SYT9_9BACT|nr:SatD family protein [Fodinibius halophilus]NGP86817.1 transcriptional regulator [Fodinibius halophilus]